MLMQVLKNTSCFLGEFDEEGGEKSEKVTKIIVDAFYKSPSKWSAGAFWRAAY